MKVDSDLILLLYSGLLPALPALQASGRKSTENQKGTKPFGLPSSPRSLPLFFHFGTGGLPSLQSLRLCKPQNAPPAMLVLWLPRSCGLCYQVGLWPVGRFLSVRSQSSCHRIDLCAHKHQNTRQAKLIIPTVPSGAGLASRQRVVPTSLACHSFLLC